MLVIEKYKDKIKEILIANESIFDALNLINIELLNEGCDASKNVLLKLLEECKEPVKVTPYELETLKLLFKREYLYITRESGDEYVEFHNSMPEFYDGICFGNDNAECSLNNTFNFIEEETIYNIEEILNNCEAIKNA